MSSEVISEAISLSIPPHVMIWTGATAAPHLRANERQGAEGADGAEGGEWSIENVREAIACGLGTGPTLTLTLSAT